MTDAANPMVVLRAQPSDHARQLVLARQQARLMAAHYRELLAQKVPAATAAKWTAMWWEGCASGDEA